MSYTEDDFFVARPPFVLSWKLPSYSIAPFLRSELPWAYEFSIELTLPPKGLTEYAELSEIVLATTPPSDSSVAVPYQDCIVVMIGSSASSGTPKLTMPPVSLCRLKSGPSETGPKLVKP